MSSITGQVGQIFIVTINLASIQIVLEIQRFKSVKACRPKTRQAKVNENSSATV
ncbi:MAG: hypothetical protein LBP59_12905 [Planctomycetaceae bacterium]|nr:hypothetical protein [Planctomycetaceae bacterium]